MPRYKVELGEQTFTFLSMEIDAADEFEAEERARDRLLDDARSVELVAELVDDAGDVDQAAGEQ